MKYLTLLLLPLLLFSCKQENGANDPEAKRQQWLASLQDSIATLRKLQSQDSTEIISLRKQIATDLESFAVVDNPREVEHYFILSEFKDSYPLSSTGIAARMLKSEQFELIAALTGHQFNSISVSNDNGASVSSAVVPADQALNYTAANLTTVAFSGSEANAIGAFVAENSSSPLTLNFLQGEAVVASEKLSDSQKRWIANTWRLTDMQNRVDSLEAARMLNTRRIELLILTLHKNS